MWVWLIWLLAFFVADFFVASSCMCVCVCVSELTVERKEEWDVKENRLRLLQLEKLTTTDSRTHAITQHINFVKSRTIEVRRLCVRARVWIGEHNRTGHAVCVSELFDDDDDDESQRMCLRAALFHPFRVCSGSYILLLRIDKTKRVIYFVVDVSIENKKRNRNN